MPYCYKRPGMLVLVLKDSLRIYFKSLSWSLGVRSLSLSLSLGGQVQEVLVLVLGGQVLVLVLGGQVLVNIPEIYTPLIILSSTKGRGQTPLPTSMGVMAGLAPWIGH